MKKILYFLFSIFYFLLPQTTLAQTTTLSVSPPVTELLLRPNTPVKHTVILKTNGGNLTVIPELHLVTPADNFGHTTISPSPVNPLDLPLVIESTPPLNQPFIMSNETLTLTLTLTALNTTAPLDSYLALVFKTSPSSTIPHQSSTILSPSISALLLTSINSAGTFPINLELSNFDLPILHDSTAPLTLSPTLHNSTSSMIRPHGELLVTSPTGKSLATIPLYPHLILGRSSRQHDLSWTPRLSNLGPHRFKLIIATEGGTTILESEKIIWLFPWRISLLSLLVMTIFSLTLARIRSRLKVV